MTPINYLSHDIPHTHHISSEAVMGVTVEVKSSGDILLCRYDRNQQLFFPRESWLALLALKTDIQSNIENKKEQKFPLGNSLFIATNVYQDNVYTNLRVWWNNQPTKQGLVLNEAEWKHFFNFLKFDKEATLAQDVLENMLITDINAFIKDTCEGCTRQYASQLDHACLMDSLGTARRCVNDIYEKLNVYDFIRKLSEKGMETHTVIKKPYDTFKIIKAVKEDEIKLNAIAKFQ